MKDNTAARLRLLTALSLAAFVICVWLVELWWRAYRWISIAPWAVVLMTFWFVRLVELKGVWWTDNEWKRPWWTKLVSAVRWRVLRRWLFASTVLCAFGVSALSLRAFSAAYDKWVVPLVATVGVCIGSVTRLATTRRGYFRKEWRGIRTRELLWTSEWRFFVECGWFEVLAWGILSAIGLLALGAANVIVAR